MDFKKYSRAELLKLSADISKEMDKRAESDKNETRKQKEKETQRK